MIQFTTVPTVRLSRTWRYLELSGANGRNCSGVPFLRGRAFSVQQKGFQKSAAFWCDFPEIQFVSRRILADALYPAKTLHFRKEIFMNAVLPTRALVVLRKVRLRRNFPKQISGVETGKNALLA